MSSFELASKIGLSAHVGTLTSDGYRPFLTFCPILANVMHMNVVLVDFLLLGIPWVGNAFLLSPVFPPQHMRPFESNRNFQWFLG